jgi:tetratricopeptide (TPR) repeat protein
MGHLKDALISYRKVTELDPHNSEIWLDYSALLALEHQYDEAIDVLKKGLREHPSDASINYRYSAYLMKAGYVKLAHEKLEEALELNFEKHSELFDYMPQLKSDRHILELIALYDKKQAN